MPKESQKYAAADDTVWSLPNHIEQLEQIKDIGRAAKQEPLYVPKAPKRVAGGRDCR